MKVLVLGLKRLLGFVTGSLRRSCPSKRLACSMNEHLETFITMTYIIPTVFGPIVDRSESAARGFILHNYSTISMSP